MPIDVSKRLQTVILRDTYTVTAADVIAGYIWKTYPLPECLLTNFMVNDRMRACEVSVSLSEVNGDWTDKTQLSLHLMQLEPTLAAFFAVIWEGERYVPPQWQLQLIITDFDGAVPFVAGDVIFISGGYDVCAQL